MSQVHLIGNAHIDPVWLWRWQEGYAEVLATFRSALDRMNEFADYVFSCAGAEYYRWVEETDPAMFCEIQRRVAEGRWVIVGGWAIQPDCNAPCGESFARHALYSQLYYQKHFGVMAKVGYNVDSFGHNAMLPQILRQSGMSAYLYMRPDANTEKSYPFEDNVFLWESPDGTQIPTYRLADAYCSGPFDNVAPRAERMRDLAQRQGLPQMSFYGVGNHGGGPTVQNLKALDALIAQGEGAYAYSSPNAYFEALDAEKLRVLRGDLQHHASGCYTAIMAIKAQNRKAEQRLLAAEKYGVLAELALGDAGTPRESLNEAWDRVLFNQFHDIMGGCSIRAAYDDALENYGEALSVAGRAMNRTLQKLAWSIDTQRGGGNAQGKYNDFRIWEQEDRGVPVVVFNPHAFDIETPVHVGTRVNLVEDDAGSVVPSQTVRSGVTNGSHDKWDTAFIARVPAMGWKTYWAHKSKSVPAAPSAHSLHAGLNSLENDWLRVELDEKSGQIRALFDKVQKKSVLRAPSAALVIDETHCDTWSHAVFSFRDVVGQFGDAQLRLVDCGDVRAQLRACSRFGKSELTQDFILWRDRPGLTIRTTVHWHEHHRMLKLSFPTIYGGGRDVCEIPYGFLERSANGKEQPMQRWVWLGQNGQGLGIATDSRTAYDALDGDLRITALRSPIFADHFGVRDELCEFSEQGEQHFELFVLPCDEERQALKREALLLTCPPERIVSTYHAGTLPRETSALRLDAESVVCTAWKRAEDGDGWVLRLHETAGKPTVARIRIPALELDESVTFDAQQIRSFRVKRGEMTPCDLLER